MQTKVIETATVAAGGCGREKSKKRKRNCCTNEQPVTINPNTYDRKTAEHSICKIHFEMYVCASFLFHFMFIKKMVYGKRATAARKRKGKKRRKLFPFSECEDEGW